MKRKILANICLFTTAIIWGFAFVAQVLGSDSLDPFSFNAIRFGVGGVSLVPVIFLLERRPRSKDMQPEDNTADRKKLKNTVLAAAVCGTILFVASSLQQAGAQITKSPGRAGFITDIYIILTPIFSTLLFRKKTKPTVFAGAAIALVGIYLLCVKPGEGFSFGIGELLILIGAFFWAFHILAIDKFGSGIYPLRFSSLQFLIVAAECSVFAFIFETTTWDMVWAARYAIFFCGVFSVGVAYTLQTYGQRLSDPSYAAIIFSLEAVFGAIGGVLYGQDTFSAVGLLGCILVFGGILLSQIDIKGAKKGVKNT